MIYCYLRVSSLAQDEQNQRVGVLRKASELNVSIDKYYIDKVSGTTDPNKKESGQIIKGCQSGRCDYCIGIVPFWQTVIYAVSDFGIVVKKGRASVFGQGKL